MSSFAMRVEGLDQLRDALGRLAPEVEQASEEAVDAEAKAIADDMRDNVPVDSGDLHESITTEVHGSTADIGPRADDVDYGQYVEFGTSSMPPQPFVTPAGEASRSRFPDRIGDVVRQAIT